MLRLKSETGWWLITHPDHARLAGSFASHWGNERFARPHPRNSVLYGIAVHDDGWAARDANPPITRQGLPSAFSQELVGCYSAFEEIDLADYLAVRDSALRQVEARDAYAALLVSMHTYNLLTQRADRSTIAPEELPLLDSFLAGQLALQGQLRSAIRADVSYQKDDVGDRGILDNFRLLQATDNLSLLSCVGYMQPATLLHPLRTADGPCEEIIVVPVATRQFRLEPYPFDERSLTFQIEARHVNGDTFDSSSELANKYAAAAIEQLDVRVSA